MNNYSLHDTFVVRQNDPSIWEIASKNDNYFEIIFINKGSGIIFHNNTKINYEQGDVIILKTNDTYTFEHKKHSIISFFSFTELLFSNKINLSERSYWMQRIELLLHTPFEYYGDIFSIEEDRKIIWDLHHLVIEEFKNKRKYHKDIIANAVSTILSIIVRNLTKRHDSSKKSSFIYDSKINLIITHLHQNVYDNELTKISFLADKFKMSQSSLSNTFKKMTGESIHQYVTKYKMKLTENRLQNTEFTISQIANQLGYTDESHLTKTFKKYYDMSPKQYREEVALEN